MNIKLERELRNGNTFCVETLSVWKHFLCGKVFTSLSGERVLVSSEESPVLCMFL